MMAMDYNVLGFVGVVLCLIYLILIFAMRKG